MLPIDELATRLEALEGDYLYLSDVSVVLGCSRASARRYVAELVAGGRAFVWREGQPHRIYARDPGDPWVEAVEATDGSTLAVSRWMCLSPETCRGALAVRVAAGSLVVDTSAPTHVYRVAA